VCPIRRSGGAVWGRAVVSMKALGTDKARGCLVEGEGAHRGRLCGGALGASWGELWGGGGGGGGW